MKPWELHPMLVHFPIAFLLGATALEIFARVRKRVALDAVVTWLLVVGVATGVATAAAGLLAYFTVPGHAESAERFMTWHPWIAGSSLVLYSVALAMRWRARDARPPGWVAFTTVFAAGLLMAAGALGGDLVYHGGAGVDPRVLNLGEHEGHHGM